MSYACGFTYSHRSKWTHPVFNNLLEASVWAWLCDAAYWKDCHVNYNGGVVNLTRGQLITSRSYISKGFCLGEQQVRTLLKKLTVQQMITQQTTSRGTIITICNYDKYQCPQPADNQPLTSSQPAPNHNKNKGKEGKEGKEVIYPPKSPQGEKAENQNDDDLASNAKPAEKKSKSKNSGASFNPSELPPEITRADWDAWLRMRDKIKKPLTEDGAKLAIAKLLKFRADGQSPTEILQNSTMNSWQGLFPLRGDNKHQNSSGSKGYNYSQTQNPGRQF